MTDLRAHAQPEKQPAESHPLVLDAAAEALFSKIFGGANTTAQKPEIATGQIRSMSVPDGWTARAQAKLPCGAGLTEFHAPGHEDIRLNSFYRGFRISATAGDAFKNVLTMPPHQLKSQELGSLTEVLRDKARDFDIFFARTSNLNGKRILSVEGCYKDQAHTGSKTIYVDTDGSGTAVQEISYTAGGKDYQAHLTEAEKAFRSIIWQ
jgi:hypothetical protein